MFRALATTHAAFSIEGTPVRNYWIPVPVSECTVTPGFSDPRSLNPIGSSDWGSLDPRIQ